MNSRQATVTIDLGAVQHNYAQVKKYAPSSKIMAIVKADAYGHGAPEVAQELRIADAFGVARMSEALALRESGVDQPICLLEGFSDPQDLDLANIFRLQMVLHTHEQIDLWSRDGARSRIWVKVDTGMGRLGFALEEASSVLKKVGQKDLLGLMSHLYDAGDKKSTRTREQLQRIQSLARNLSFPGGEMLNISNSGGILGQHQPYGGWVRPGLMLYGASPFDDYDPIPFLRPVMSFDAPVISVRDIMAGQSVGYSGIWTADKNTKIAVIAAGYADGYPREITQGAPVIINGQKYPLVGRVSMDMICVQVSDGQPAKVGDRAVLWGEGLPVEEIAKKAGTIPYTLLCGVTSRVKREFLGSHYA